MSTYDVYPRAHNTTQSATAQTQTVAQGAGAMTLDCSLGSNILVTLSGNVTSWSLTNGVAGQVYGVKFTQDATGSRTITSAAATIIFLSADYLDSTPTRTAPTLTTTAAHSDYFVFYFDGTNYVEIARSYDIT